MSQPEPHDFALHAAPRGRQGMRFLARRHDDESRDPVRVPLCERQRHHAAVGGADNGVQLPDAERIQHCHERGGLIERAQRGENGIGACRARGGTATTDVVDSQYLPAQGVYPATMADASIPPATLFRGDHTFR